MQKILRLIARLIVARHECTYIRHCKENAPIYMYYVAPETSMMSSVIADCPDLAPPQYFWQVYACDCAYSIMITITHLHFVMEFPCRLQYDPLSFLVVYPVFLSPLFLSFLSGLNALGAHLKRSCWDKRFISGQIQYKIIHLPILSFLL